MFFENSFGIKTSKCIILKTGYLDREAAHQTGAIVLRIKLLFHFSFEKGGSKKQWNVGSKVS